MITKQFGSLVGLVPETVYLVLELEFQSKGKRKSNCSCHDKFHYGALIMYVFLVCTQEYTKDFYCAYILLVIQVSLPSDFYLHPWIKQWHLLQGVLIKNANIASRVREKPQIIYKLHGTEL